MIPRRGSVSAGSLLGGEGNVKHGGKVVMLDIFNNLHRF